MNGKTEQLQTGLIELLPELRRFAYSLTSDRDAADDLTQSALERALTKASAWDSSRPLKFWVFRIARNLWLDQLRAEKVRGNTEDIDDEGVDIADDRLAAMHTTQELREVTDKMRELPEDQRAVLALVAVEGYSYKETAELLDIPVGTVMSRLSRARKTLIEHFDL